jgi:hypothetical protein
MGSLHTGFDWNRLMAHVLELMWFNKDGHFDKRTKIGIRRCPMQEASLEERSGRGGARASPQSAQDH